MLCIHVHLSWPIFVGVCNLLWVCLFFFGQCQVTCVSQEACRGCELDRTANPAREMYRATAYCG